MIRHSRFNSWLTIWTLLAASCALACRPSSFGGDSAEIGDRPKTSNASGDPADVDIEELLGTENADVIRPPSTSNTNVDMADVAIDQRRIVISQQPFDGGRLVDNFGRLRCNAKTDRACSAVYNVNTAVILSAPPKISVGGVTYLYKAWICNQEKDSFPKGKQMCALSGLSCAVKTTVNLICGAVFVRDTSNVDMASGGSNPNVDMGTNGSNPNVDMGDAMPLNPFGDLGNAGTMGPNIDSNAANCIEPPDPQRDCGTIAKQFFEEGVRDPGTGRLFRGSFDDPGYTCLTNQQADNICRQRGGLSIGANTAQRWAEYNPALVYCLTAIYDFRIGGKRIFTLGLDSPGFGLTQGSGGPVPFCRPPQPLPTAGIEIIECVPGQTAIKFSLACHYP